ncbi:hypothetical protein M0R45_009747 [Rubus argutus]|uniref:Uncharacterized protein n=1 Tax=Rubus argutus TaxID=59490 RepID=A0AAW1Y5C7_RUBAR
MMKTVESEAAVSTRGAGLGRSSQRRRRVPPVRGAIKRKIFALILKRLKLASQHVLHNCLLINCRCNYS